MADKVHKTLRLMSETAERVRGLMADGESETAAYVRVIEAGLACLEAVGNETRPPEEAESGGGAPDQGGTMRALTQTIEALTAQLEIKDEQIRALTRITEESQTITKQAQTLHAVSESKTKELTETTGEAKEGRGFLYRLFH